MAPAIRFMPEEVDTYAYSLGFSDGTPIPNPSGQFTVVESTLPGPLSLMGTTPPHSYFFKDARSRPVKWKSYALMQTVWLTNNGGYEYWEPDVIPFMNNVIDNHLIAKGYNANGSSNSINPSGVDGSFQLTWLNPLDVTLTPAGTVAGNQTVSLVPPASTAGEWLAFLKATTAHLPGDVTCKRVVDHADTIGALKIVAEASNDLPTCSPTGADVDGDNRFSLAEAIETLGVGGQ